MDQRSLELVSLVRSIHLEKRSNFRLESKKLASRFTEGRRTKFDGRCELQWIRDVRRGFRFDRNFMRRVRSQTGQFESVDARFQRLNFDVVDK